MNVTVQVRLAPTNPRFWYIDRSAKATVAKTKRLTGPKPIDPVAIDLLRLDNLVRSSLIRIPTLRNSEYIARVYTIGRRNATVGAALRLINHECFETTGGHGVPPLQLHSHMQKMIRIISRALDRK